MQTRVLKVSPPLLLTAFAAVLIFAGTAQAQTDATTIATSDGIEEVVVTASRRPEPLSDVPASVQAFTQATMDAKGVRTIDDLALLTPGLDFVRSSQFTGSTTNISIRGIASTIGAGTTGIYIDDVPVQARVVGFSSTNAYPRVFDLARVEVLRGPQGTLFGAGSEGGAVRFITPQPSLSDYSVYGRSEIAFTDGGAPTYEGGVAGGGPLVDGKLGFRASAWFRRDGGWIDRANFATGAVIDKNANSQETTVLKAAVTWAPTSALHITPAIYYQNVSIADTGAYWERLSNPSKGIFKTGNVQAQPGRDHFVLPSLGVTYDFGDASLISTTAYFDRTSREHRDYTNFDAEKVWPGHPFPVFPGQVATGYVSDTQRNFTHEMRVQSNDPDARLTWVVGGFFGQNKQVATQRNQDSFYEPLLMAVYRINLAKLGQAYLPGKFIFDSTTTSKTTQIAGFGQADYKITENLTATAGVRMSHLTIKHAQDAIGPWATPAIHSAGKTEETPVTPKFGLSYKFSDHDLVYASVSKGFRPGGAQTIVPTGLCGADLAALGLASSPADYGADHVWSYEAGSKNALFGGRVRTTASAYWVKWNNVQRFVTLPRCGAGFIINAGSVTSKGFDLAIHGDVTENLSLGITLGYTDASYDQTVTSGTAVVLAQKGDSALLGPDFTMAVAGQYRFIVLGRDGFVRADYTFAGAEHVLNPAVFGTNLVNTPAPQTHKLNLRAGVQLEQFDVSVFANNVTNAHPGLYRHQLFPGSPLITNTSFRPRTIGINAIFRY
jgi:outer membrane receptor protein involved in Fe transport